MQERREAVFAEWAKRMPVEYIPKVLAFLTARLLTEGPEAYAGRPLAGACNDQKLLTANELAAQLSIHESWIRTEERAGRIPGVRLGKYVRFKLSDVERALADRQPRRVQA
jgi:excisionase family DNA binding protein